MKNRNLSLTIAYSPRPAMIDHSWLRLEQVDIAPPQATIGETADLVDQIYQIDPCNAGNHEGQAIAADKFQNIVKKSFDLALCDTAPNGETAIKLMVILSDPAAQYVVRLSHGAKIGQTILVEKEVSLQLPVKNAYSLVLPWPVVAEPAISWSGSVYGPGGMIIDPDIDRVGNTIFFPAALTGMILAQYLTRYYLIDITVPGNTDCRALCFAMDLVAELELVRPISQGTLSDWEKYCNPNTVVIFKTPDVSCYKMVEMSWLCACDTGRESRSATVMQSVTCPDGFADTVTQSGSYQIGTDHVVAGYEHCPDSVNPFFNVSDPDFYKEKCCHAVPDWMSLPTCLVKTSKNPGGVPIENGADFYIGLYGPGTKIVPVSPADGDCGVMETTQDVYQHNCCDGITPIYWDYTNSAEIISDYSKGLVTVTGGRPPYVWQIRGSGFWGNAACTYRDVETEVPYLWIYTKDACGPCYVYVTDGCSSQKATIRSDIGQWVFITNNPKPCLVKLDCGTPIAATFNECIQGKYKSQESWSGVSGSCCVPDCQTAIDVVCSGHGYPETDYPSCSYSSPPAGYTDCGTGLGISYIFDPEYGALYCPGAATMVSGMAPHLKTTSNSPGYYLYEWRC